MKGLLDRLIDSVLSHLPSHLSHGKSVLLIVDIIVQLPSLLQFRGVEKKHITDELKGYHDNCKEKIVKHVCWFDSVPVIIVVVVLCVCLFACLRAKIENEREVSMEPFSLRIHYLSQKKIIYVQLGNLCLLAKCYQKDVHERSNEHCSCF